MSGSTSDVLEIKGIETKLDERSYLGKQYREGKDAVSNDASTDNQRSVLDGSVFEKVGVILWILLH